MSKKSGYIKFHTVHGKEAFNEIGKRINNDTITAKDLINTFNIDENDANSIIMHVKAKRNHSLSQENIATIWHLSSNVTISKIFSNKYNVSEENTGSLARLLGWQTDYFDLNIECCRTQEEQDNYLKLQMEEEKRAKIEEHETFLKYLNSLQIKVELHPYLIYTYSEMKNQFNDFKDFLFQPDMVKDQLLSNNDSDEQKHLFRLKDSGYSLFFYDEISDKDGVIYDVIGDSIFMADMISKVTKEKGRIASKNNFDLFYEVILSDTRHYISISKMHDFICSMDEICKSAASTLLSSETFNYK